MIIFIPTPLRSYADGNKTVELDAETVSAALDGLTSTHPALRNHLFTPEGRLRAFVNLYLNDEDVRYLPGKEDSAVKAGDTLTIIPSIAGGTGVQHSHVSLAASGRGLQERDSELRHPGEDSSHGCNH